MLTRTTSRATVAAAVAALGGTVLAQDLFVYPAKGQSDEQLATDRYECHRWASVEADFDPTEFGEEAPPRTVRVPVPKNESENATRTGAIVGAAAGAVIGAHNDEAGEGLVVGAILGTIAGSAVEEHGEREAREQARAEAEARAADLERTRSERALRRSDYRRALTACLEGRGYSVK